ncbi:DUF5136 domain-containing protein [Streptomyces sp. ITFR-6]|uniref:D-alanyl-D-alanine carboxypeptidase n=1 Tax=Streptomyces sp. ITFR-6 TaxID=3075197 RepID=UPI00288C26E8|nr:DUF5136 domain-containing protein [Streptomyces sp. ITFR-6]WNI29707.1 DUF5136 domain-containing protein [Streptomyces sp. ITFR-6]
MNQLHTPKASRNQETGRLSFMDSVSPARQGRLARGGLSWRYARRVIPSVPIFTSTACTFSTVSALKKTALAVTSAALLSTFAVVSPASAAAKDTTDDAPKPPAGMSRVGGEQLGLSGTQVNLGPGAPVLPKDLTGRSWMVSDAESGEVLASHNPHWRLPPASTLKMLFADTVMPAPALQPKTRKYTVKDDDLADMGEGSSLVGVKEDLSYTVHDLWLGVFLRSGNDAVHVLSAMYGGIPKTVHDMNSHAEELQALDTNVVSPDGYDSPKQVSSAYDLTLFARSGLQNADFREYCSTGTAEFPGKKEKGEKREEFGIQNTNRLLTGADGVTPYKGIAGVKNGYTSHAGNTFTGVAERNGKVLLVTVMHPSSEETHSVYKEAASLLDWGFSASGKVTPVGELVPPKSEMPDSGAGKGAEADGPTAKAQHGAAKTTKAAATSGSGGVGIALGIVGGALVLVAGAVYLVNRRWPLPDLVRRRPRP